MEKFQIMGKKLEHHGHILDFYTYELKVPNGIQLTGMCWSTKGLPPLFR